MGFELPRQALRAAGGSLASIFIAASCWAQAPISLADFCTPSAGDRTECIQKWVQAGAASTHKKLYAPPGTYGYRGAATIYHGMQLECAGSGQTVFRNIDPKRSAVLFQSLTPVNDVRIEGCGFDVNGNPEKFLAVIDVSPEDLTLPWSTNIRVRRNRIFDGARPGKPSKEQRQYITLLKCSNCRIERNHLSEGGRIKVGRPGNKLRITRNTLEHVNDNAITVADRWSGVSQDIVIARNAILNPVGIGIFFGGDGDGENSPALTLTKVRVKRNRIEGSWDFCIFGRLPAQASDIRIQKNVCLKTESSKRSDPSGIILKRTCRAYDAATRIRVSGNKVQATLPAGSAPALDQGGIQVSGIYRDVQVNRNEIRDVGPRAMYFRYVKMTETVVKTNELIGGTFVILGDVAGDLQPNSRTATSVPIPEDC